MKKLFISALLATTLLAVACTKTNEPTDGGEVTPPSGDVSFTLGVNHIEGSAELFDSESTIANVAVAIFTKGGSFHSAVTPRLEGGRYTFELEEGNWRIWVLANAQTATQLSETLTAGESREGDFLALTVDGVLAAGRRIPMLSAHAMEFYRDPAKHTLLGDAEMVRMAARVDIINAVDNLTITRVVVKSRAVTGAIGTASMPAGTDYLDDKALNNLSVEGSYTSPTIIAGEIYSYENLNTAGDDAMKVVVDYNYLDEDHQAEFTFNEGVRRGNLYSLQFTFDGHVRDHQAATWGRGGRLTADFSSQVLRNRELAIFNFAATNVKSISAEGVVTFCATNNEVPYYTQWKQEFETDVYTDAEGNRWRVPTQEEMSLMMISGINYAFYTSGTRDQLDYSETLPGVLFGVSGAGGTGDSDFWTVPSVGTGYSQSTIYAVRFSGTAQMAAYSYRFVDNAVCNIRVKALDFMESAPAKAVVCDEAFWDDYLEFNFYAPSSNNAYVWTSTQSDQYSAWRLTLTSSNLALYGNMKTSAQTGLRLVRAE